MSWQSDLRDAADTWRRRERERPQPWWVVFDEPARGIFSRGHDGLAMARTLVGMRLPVDPAPTDDADCTLWRLGGVERLAVEVSDMPAVMQCVRLTGLHGHYREAGQLEVIYKF